MSLFRKASFESTPEDADLFGIADTAFQFTSPKPAGSGLAGTLSTSLDCPGSSLTDRPRRRVRRRPVNGLKRVQKILTTAPEGKFPQSPGQGGAGRREVHTTEQVLRYLKSLEPQ